MNPVDEMRDLIEKLNYYTKLYDEGKSPISDKEWDDMYFHLKKLEEETGISLGNSPTIHVDYQVVNQLKKVNLPNSLKKIKQLAFAGTSIKSIKLNEEGNELDYLQVFKIRRYCYGKNGWANLLTML